MFTLTSLVILLVSARQMVQADPYSDDKCGETRGCFDCRDVTSTCAVNVAWEPDADEGVVKFNLWGSMTGSTAHVSVGITSSQDMYNADVYSCISNGTGGVLVRSWNPTSGRTTNPRPLIGVYDQEVDEVDGEIRCQFYRNMSLPNGAAQQFFDISGDNNYYLILSAGGASGEMINGHTLANSGASASTIQLSEVSAANIARYGIWTLLLSFFVAILVAK